MPITFTITIDDIDIKYFRLVEDRQGIRVVAPFDFLTDRDEAHKSGEITFWEKRDPTAPYNHHALDLSAEESEILRGLMEDWKDRIMEREGIS